MKLAPFVIFDTEFTAWEGSHHRNWNQPGEHREIIQIAAAIVDPRDSFNICSTFNVLVKPRINPTLSDYIQNLTGISQAKLASEGVVFSHALQLFHTFTQNDALNAYCWGSDEEVFLENCELNQIDFSNYFTGFYDIRHVFEDADIDTSKYQSGSVYKSVGLSLDGQQHDALNDVKSITTTLQYLHKNNCLREIAFLNCASSRTQIK